MSSKKSLRQQLRDQADTQLADIAEDVVNAAGKHIPDCLGIADVLRLVSSDRTASLRSKLVTQLADVKEAELVEFFNKQEDLPLGDSDASA